MPCLKQAVRVNDVIRDKMRVSSPPPPSTVVANLRRISPSTLERWPLSEKVTAVFGRIFAHLWSKWGEVGEGERQELRGMAIIPVGGDLLRPSRVFFRLEGSFAPLMFELPRVYGAHEPLLRQLGVREAHPRVTSTLSFSRSDQNQHHRLSIQTNFALLYES